jgi:hypothetical protein
MTKNDLLKALKDLPDDAPVTLYIWNGRKSTEFYLNPTCQQYPDRLVLANSGVEVSPADMAPRIIPPEGA